MPGKKPPGTKGKGPAYGYSGGRRIRRVGRIRIGRIRRKRCQRSKRAERAERHRDNPQTLMVQPMPKGWALTQLENGSLDRLPRTDYNGNEQMFLSESDKGGYRACDRTLARPDRLPGQQGTDDEDGRHGLFGEERQSPGAGLAQARFADAGDEAHLGRDPCRSARLLTGQQTKKPLRKQRFNVIVGWSG
jgi:hypothetical protein